MKSNNFISEYWIVEYYCQKGSRGSSTVKINYNSKEYNVALDYNTCEALMNNNRGIKLFYDNSLDQVFHKTGLNIRIVILFGCVFIFFILFWFLPKKYW